MCVNIFDYSSAILIYTCSHAFVIKRIYVHICRFGPQCKSGHVTLNREQIKYTYVLLMREK